MHTLQYALRARISIDGTRRCENFNTYLAKYSNAAITKIQKAQALHSNGIVCKHSVTCGVA